MSAPQEDPRGMGHFIFLMLHLAAFLFFGIGWLFITVPVHLVYAALAGRAPAAVVDAPSPETHVRCPECRELILKDARKCKHCGTRLVPQE
jgi:uncharacterized paraquat-inducible protein A